MPNHIYCQSCGFPNAYTISKPNFCGKCATPLATSSFAGISKPSISPTPVIAPQPVYVPQEEPRAPVNNHRRTRREIEEEEAEEIPDIDNLRFKIEGSQNENHRTVNLEDAIFNNPKPFNPKDMPKGKRISKKNAKQAFDELMAKASSRTPAQEIGGIGEN